ncbi:phosphoglucosamine mutase [Rhodococcus sp. BP-252]|uniref:Phosphoglucosamine mutase n=1 Tax=Rhodococcoides kyotonense TaxID=398843 RepID=A0A177Y672_9NOCA|nr:MULTISPECIES: phosphoglucosamine mutase [Rhodococcus]MBY6410543.1 phosphoglucosamine mutase [Rhodococcus sp. BP-320]MBY6417838.1 phosphoglucosamine mutase [Rhodococcus sp. BP-321]MBY6422833.1 phosphoglucosamine mutase [Rhodococcus sp. BP-324]MBY6425099.1 phosphoglucosamine mutase [Rhodococcus sp. BP-323]MBY6430195.1 phosphoglucosamine mutase [Rhodococcus sp. BP-322]
MTRLFGTDGVRGLANALLTPELAVKVARAAATVLAPRNGSRPVAVVGRDPRASGEMLSAAVIAGLTASGVDVVDVGVLPTPAVACLTASYDAALGVMISASHNPMPDNGIKIFASGGHKLEDDVENRIESLITGDGELPAPTGAAIGRVRVDADAGEKYVEHLRTAVGHDLAGLTVVVDCANGAASSVAPAVYSAAGATVVAIHADPDGLNINDECGSTHLEDLQNAVVKHGADIGIGHDGDADRCLAVDASGAVVDGDAIMAVLAIAMKESGELAENTLVATVMSNLGLHIAMRQAGIALRTAAVGDRYVLEELRAGNFSLGGEQSGHVVIPALGTTGDGILTALRLMARMAQTGRTLADLASVMQTLPQVLINVKVSDKAAVASSKIVVDGVAEVERQLGDNGRVLLRPSGTEQLVRVMVEASEPDLARRLAQDLADRVGQV